MTLVTALIIVAVITFVLLLALAPSAPAKRNPFPHRPNRRLSRVPGQRTIRHHTR
ncbi:hypothetical protein [Streptomyces sp. NBC_00083]|uniref:hypothetical protein n=1 Tax=Streptomyces sp. NBC_00083 TaxID=2975647 RepID=UPI00224F7C2C|nr:hypothetical protein [Streptomyces sp. NBC_00083]MCX5387280.1 hypothetical protein [Streptomyces sp. NBC_00083]